MVGSNFLAVAEKYVRKMTISNPPEHVLHTP